jgi:uncharacterized protein (TIGR03437 family)
MNPFAILSSGFRYFLIVSLLTSTLFSCDDDDEPPVPEVTSINPSSALPNTLVSITGKSFSQVFSENKVSFNGKDALVTNASSTQLNVMVPEGAETGPVVVTVRGKTAVNQVVFTVLALPSEISNVTPTTGGYNTQVTITGANFFPTPEANVVTFNGVQGVVSSATSTSLNVKVPARAGSGPVVVNGVAAPVKFNYIPEVFIAGYIGDASGYSRATYWKNGVPTTLANTGLHTFANDIAVVNDDVYVAGSRQLLYGAARWWKNGVEMPLSNDAYYSSAESILVSGSDVYISGFEANASGKTIAKYWKNGTPVNLTDGSTSAYTYDLAVVDQHVYVGGTTSDASGDARATYWKDGVANVLTTGVSFIWDMYVSGDDVYTTGSIRNTGPGVGFVSYWKNDEDVLLGPGLGGGAGRGITVVGDDVYVAGVEDNSKFVRLAKYWKNGNPVILTDGASYAVAYAIDVLGEDVYVVGMEYNSTGIAVAKYWKNGVPIALTDGSYYAMAQAIVLR